MTKYNEEVLNVAENAVTAAFDHHLTDRWVAKAVFDTLERAPWWEKVEPEYRFRIGEPWRREISSSSATEGTVRQDGQIGNVIARPDATYFRDTRWSPPLAVGDVIETVEDLERLPVGAGVVDYREEIALKRCEQRWNYANLSSESCGSESVMGLAPITVVYLPKTEATEIINATKKAAKTKEEMA